MIHQVLAETNRIVKLKEDLLKSLGNNGQVIIELLPELEWLIGKQTQVPELGANENQNRFLLTFGNFMKAIASKEHPLVIFLDDLQWIDLGTLKILELLATGAGFEYLMLIGSYRDNEMNAAHPLSMFLSKLQESGKEIKSVYLAPLQLENVVQFISDTLHKEPDVCVELCKLIVLKTGGNPFYIKEFIKALYADGLLGFNFEKQDWEWDETKIQNKGYTNNIIDLLTKRIEDLSEKALYLLKIGSCAGKNFSLSLLLKMINNPLKEVIEFLMESLTAGFIQCSQDLYQLFIENNETKDLEFQFVHDRIQQAAYNLINAEEKERIHCEIGILLLDLYSEVIEEKIFEITDQLNSGIRRVENRIDSLELCKLNVSACKKAKESTVYNLAYNYQKSAIELLGEESWKLRYDLSLSLYTEMAEICYLKPDFNEMDYYGNIVLEKSGEFFDKIKIYGLRIQRLFAENRLSEAAQEGLNVLNLLGFKFSLNPTKFQIIKSLIQVKLALRGKTDEDFKNLPKMKRQDIRHVINIIITLGTSLYRSNANLLVIVIFKNISLIIKYGYIPETAFLFSSYSMILCGGLGEIDAGNRYGKLAMELNDRMDVGKYKARTILIFELMVHHWKEHLRDTLQPLYDAYQFGLEVGDNEYAVTSITNYFFYSYLTGLTLDSLFIEMSAFYYNIKSLKHEAFIRYHEINMQAISNLKEEINDPILLNGDIFCEDKMISILKDCNDRNNLFIANFHKVVLSYLFGNYQKAMEYSDTTKLYVESVIGVYCFSLFYFYESLIILALYPDLTRSEQKKKLKVVVSNQKKLRKWAEHAPMNHLHKWYLVEAEIARALNQPVQAIEFFLKAIEGSKKNRYLQEEALANELLAKLNFSIGQHIAGKSYINESYRLYEKWGAKNKLSQLKRNYNILTIENMTGTTGNTYYSEQLDLKSIIKASQAISGEIKVKNLAQKLMKVVLENAGAQRGLFLFQEKDKLIIFLEGNIGENEYILEENSFLKDKTDRLCASIVYYVKKTGTTVMLDNASQEGIFTNDDYIRNHKSKSILCLPIFQKEHLLGIIYLENNLSTNVFTRNRLEVLNVLCSQAVISMENAQLYEHLEEKVEERTHDLNQALLNVKALKEQQDGDYFLNTLLIEPLGQNNATSKTVEIEFFVKQKKRFMFRKDEYELGGDINISENIELQGKPYIVFLNGDAMGKSIQGAGGVLVLGTVFKSIIQRTISTAYSKNVYPERWIKNAFIEMHKAFESFDGLMLMSTVFGLIDENTGTMYFINAEHPQIVLYREGFASFIDNPIRYTKLGTKIHIGSISVEVFSLLSDDVVILGSDGRDDIIIGKNADGRDIINLDEFLFLSHVRKADGNLEKIYDEILAAGKLMDDLSLLKIYYKGGNADQKKLEETLKQLEDCKKENRFEEYTGLGEGLISDYPHLTKYLLEVSFAYRNIGQFEKAIDFGERMRLRDPLNLDNLINLIDSYKCIGKKDRANTILDFCLKTKPEDSRLKAISIHF